MANLLSWGFDKLKGGVQTVNRDVVHPVEHAAGNVIHAGGNVVHAVEAAPTVVNRDVIQPVAQRSNAAVAQVNPFDSGRTYNTVMQRGANFVPHPNQSLLFQATHNGLTNVAGGVVKPLIQFPLDYANTFANIGNRLGGDTNQTIQQNFNDPFTRNLVKVSGATGTNRQLLGSGAQVALTALTPGAGKVVDKSFEAVAPKVIPRLVTRTVANAGTGAVVGAPFNVANYISSNQPITKQGLEQAALQGAQAGAVLGGAGTIAGAAAPVVSKTLVRGTKAATPTATLHHTLLEKNPSYAALQERLNGSAAAANKINQNGGSKVALNQHLKNIDNIQRQMAEMRRQASTKGSLNPDYSSITPEGNSLPKRTSVNPRLPKTQSSARKETLSVSSKNSVAPEVQPKPSPMQVAADEINNKLAAIESKTGKNMVEAPRPTQVGKTPEAAGTSKGVIIKESKPLPDGSKVVIRATRNPATGHLDIRQERVAKTTDQRPASPQEIGKALGMSDAELASLAKSATSQELSSRGLEPLPKRFSNPNPESALSATHERFASRHSLSTDIPQLEDVVQGHPSYPIKKKVGLIDYMRTPERVLNKIGLGKEAQALRAADHAYKAELPKQIEQIKKWHTEVGNSPEVSQRIFQYLDGQKVRLSPIEQNVANQMKSTLKGWADRLGIPEEHRITNYITHIFDESLVGKEFDPELEKLIADRVPGSVYDPYTQQRLGAKGYVEDAFRAMEAYTKRAVRKANFDPALEKLSSAAEGLDLSGWNYVKHYGDRINMRPTMIDNLLDNSIKQSPIGYKFGNRPTAAISRAIRQATYRASLGLNVGSAVRNLTQGINTFAELGTKWTGVGYTKALQAIARGSQELKDTGVLDNSFVEDRTISVAKQALQKVDKGLFSFFEAAEKVNRGAAYFGAKAKALHEGKSLEQAVQAGVAAARKTQFTFGRVDTPVALQYDLTKLLTQFQSYNVKQAEFLGEMIKNKEFAKLLRFTGASAVVFLTVGRALGYRPTDMLPSAQIGGAPPFKVPAATGQAIVKIFTAKDSKNSTRGQQVQKAWMNAGSKLGSATIPGFTQGKKTVTGINAVNREQVKKGSTNYTIQPSTGNFIKGAVFGPYSLNGPKSTPSVSIGSGSGAVKLTPIQSDAFNKQNGAAYQQLVARLHQTAGYKVATPTQQKKMDTTLKAQVTSAMKRQYSANNNIGSGLAKPPKSSDTSILSGSLPPQSAKGGGVKIAPNLDKNSTNVLTKYASTTARAKWFNSQDDAQYQYDLAKYNNDKANGTLTVAQDIQTQTKLAKEQVGSTYSKNVRDLYTLSKTELYNYLTKPEKGVNKGQIADQLLAYDQALYNAGLEKSLKFKTGIAPSSGGSGGRSSKYDKVATANLKFALAQKPLKIVGALPAPSKATGPKFITPALKTVYQKKAVNTHPTVSVTKTKHP